MRAIERLAAVPARAPAVAAAPVLVLALLSLPLLPGLRIDNATERWIDRDSEAWRLYSDFRAEFGSEEFILLIYELPPEIDRDFLFRLTELRLELEAISGVRRVLDLSSVYARFFSQAGPERFDDDLRRSPFYRGLLRSADGRWTASWVDVDPRRPEERSAMVEAVEDVARRWDAGGGVRLAGPPVLNAELDRSSRRAARAFFPLVFALSAAVLLWRFRSLRSLAVCYLPVGAGIAVTLAAMRLTGGTLDMLTVSLPPVLWVLGLSTSIHLLSRYRRRVAAGTDVTTAIERSLGELARPCLFSAVTTALGFVSLTFASLEPVRRMGAYAALGVLLCVAFNFLLFPCLAAGDRPRASGATAPRGRSGGQAALLARPARDHAVGVLGIGAVLAAALALAVPRIEVESNVVEFLRSDHPLVRTYTEILPQLTGPYSLEVLLTPPPATPPVEMVAASDRLAGRLEQLPGVARVLDAADLVAKTSQRTFAASPDAADLPRDPDTFAVAWDATARQLPRELAAFYRPETGTLRLSVLAAPMGSGAHRELVSRIRATVDAEVDPSWRPRLTGIVDLLVEMQAALVRSQVRSFAAAFVLIGPVIGLLLGSLRYALLSAAPNLLPVLCALGAMALLGIRLDPATVMIAAMALGIAVDDTIHFLTAYLDERRRGLAAPGAVERTLRVVGGPMALTSGIAALGFLVLCLSDFVPLRHFGLLTALTLGAALLGDLLLLPSLLVVADREAA